MSAIGFGVVKSADFKSGNNGIFFAFVSSGYGKQVFDAFAVNCIGNFGRTYGNSCQNNGSCGLRLATFAIAFAEVVVNVSGIFATCVVTIFVARIIESVSVCRGDFYLANGTYNCCFAIVVGRRRRLRSHL